MCIRDRVTSIRQANITNTVGTSECPFVTAPLEKMSIDADVYKRQEKLKMGTTIRPELSEKNPYWIERHR